MKTDIKAVSRFSNITSLISIYSCAVCHSDRTPYLNIMDTRTATLVLVLLYFSAMAAQAEDTTTEGDDHHVKTKRHLLVVKREEEDKSGESQSDEEISFGPLKRSIQDDLHRPINDDTDSLGPLVAKLHQKRCARPTTTTAATTTTTAAASG